MHHAKTGLRRIASNFGLDGLVQLTRARGDRHPCRAIITLVARAGPHYSPRTVSARVMDNTGDELVVGWGRRRPDSVALFAHGGRSQ